MAEEYLRKIGGECFEVESAGLEPGELNPYAVEVLREYGIDISGKKTRDVLGWFRAGKTYRFVITFCCREAEKRCPIQFAFRRSFQVHGDPGGNPLTDPVDPRRGQGAGAGVCRVGRLETDRYF